MKKVHTNKGFTLAELLIVVAVIAILVAVAIPTFGDQLEKSRQSTDIQTIRAAYSVASLAALEDKVNDEAIKSTSNDEKSTKIYYFNAGTGKLMKAPEFTTETDDEIDANSTVASAAKIQSQSRVLKIGTTNTMLYSYDDTNGDRQNAGNSTSPMWYSLAVNMQRAVLKVTFVETGVDTFDFDVSSVTFTNPKTVTFTFPEVTKISVVKDTAQADISLPTSAVGPNETPYGTPTYTATGVPDWLEFGTNGLFTAKTDAPDTATTSDIEVTVTVQDDNGGIGTYTQKIAVTDS